MHPEPRRSRSPRIPVGNPCSPPHFPPPSPPPVFPASCLPATSWGGGNRIRGVELELALREQLRGEVPPQLLKAPLPDGCHLPCGLHPDAQGGRVAAPGFPYCVPILRADSTGLRIPGELTSSVQTPYQHWSSIPDPSRIHCPFALAYPTPLLVTASKDVLDMPGTCGYGDERSSD